MGWLETGRFNRWFVAWMCAMAVLLVFIVLNHTDNDYRDMIEPRLYFIMSMFTVVANFVCAYQAAKIKRPSIFDKPIDGLEAEDLDDMRRILASPEAPGEEAAPAAGPDDDLDSIKAALERRGDRPRDTEEGASGDDWRDSLGKYKAEPGTVQYYLGRMAEMGILGWDHVGYFHPTEEFVDRSFKLVMSSAVDKKAIFRRHADGSEASKERATVEINRAADGLAIKEYCDAATGGPLTEKDADRMLEIISVIRQAILESDYDIEKAGREIRERLDRLRF